MARAAAGRKLKWDREAYAHALAVATVRRYGERNGLPDTDDLMSAALVGAAEALAKFRPERGSFPSFAIVIIRGQIANAIRDWRPGKRAASVSVEVVSYDAPRETDEPEGFVDTFPDPDADTERDGITRAWRGEWAALCEELPRRQRELVRRHYWQGETLASIARDWGVSEPCVHWHRARAHERLRRMATLHGLAPDKTEPGPVRPGQVRGERHYRAKLTDQQVQEMRDAYRAGGVTHKTLGERYGVHTNSAGRIVSGLRRKG